MKPFEQPIYVTRPYLPPLSAFAAGLEEIWGNGLLSNNGPVLRRFENNLRNVFQTKNVCLFTNGTLALQLGLHSLNLSGEVITTPFTFAATTNALSWNGLQPVFCDIRPDFFTIDPDKIEALITPRTSAILAVHVFGFPCLVDRLAAIAEKHHLTLIYDAAHAFGIRLNKQSIANYGDMSMFSFHATKHFHTAEGGALTFQNQALKNTLERMLNNGLDPNSTDIFELGTNAKMSELQALMGDIVLTHLDEMLLKKAKIAALYRERLETLTGIRFCPMHNSNIDYNYCFMPIQIIANEFGADRDFLFDKLKEYNIFTRKYFSPLIPNFKFYNHAKIPQPLIVATKVESQILTLPIYVDLALEDVDRICDIIIKIQRTLN